MSKPGTAKSYVGSDRVAERGEIVDLQKNLLQNGFRLLKSCSTEHSAYLATPYLVYSTCSLDENQNEGVVRWLLDTHEDAELCPVEPSQLCGSVTDGSLRQYNVIKGEGAGADVDISARGNLLIGIEGERKGGGEGGGVGEVEGRTEGEAEADSTDLGVALTLIRMDRVQLLQAVRTSKSPFYFIIMLYLSHNYDKLVAEKRQ